jgi:hypothetical protein
VIGVEQDGFILGQPWQEPVTAAAGGDFMPAGRMPGVLTEAIDAE